MRSYAAALFTPLLLLRAPRGLASDMAPPKNAALSEQRTVLRTTSRTLAKALHLNQSEPTSRGSCTDDFKMEVELFKAKLKMNTVAVRQRSRGLINPDDSRFMTYWDCITTLALACTCRPIDQRPPHGSPMQDLDPRSPRGSHEGDHGPRRPDSCARHTGTPPSVHQQRSRL